MAPDRTTRDSGPIPRGATIQRSNGQVSREIDGEAVMLGITSGKYYSLAGVGATVWALLDQPTRFDVLVERVVAEFEVDPLECRRDLEQLIRELHAEGLIEVTE